MEKELPRLSNKSIVLLIFIIPVSFLLGLIISSVIIPGSKWPPSPQTIVATLIGPVVLVGFIIYGANLRDERTVQVSDKAARNGFMFILLVVPILLVVLSVTGFSNETLLTLVFIWIGAVTCASISAFYYYRK